MTASCGARAGALRAARASRTFGRRASAAFRADFDSSCPMSSSASACSASPSEPSSRYSSRRRSRSRTVSVQSHSPKEARSRRCASGPSLPYLECEALLSKSQIWSSRQRRPEPRRMLVSFMRVDSRAHPRLSAAKAMCSWRRGRYALASSGVWPPTTYVAPTSSRPMSPGCRRVCISSTRAQSSATMRV